MEKNTRVKNINALYLVPPTVPPQSKIRLCTFLQMTHLKKLTKPICHEMHHGVRTKVQEGELFHLVLTTASCHWAQNGGPGPKLQSKKSTSIFRTSVFNVYFHNLKTIYHLSWSGPPTSGDPICPFNLIVSFTSIYSRDPWELLLSLSDPIGLSELLVKSSLTYSRTSPFEEFD